MIFLLYTQEKAPRGDPLSIHIFVTIDCVLFSGRHNVCHCIRGSVYFFEGTTG